MRPRPDLASPRPRLGAPRRALRVAVACLALAAPGAAAEPAVAELAGSYEVAFDEVASSCGDRSLALSTATLVLGTGAGRTGEREPRLTLRVPGLPELEGRPAAGGRFRVAADTRRGRRARPAGRFTAAGRVADGALSMVLVAELALADDSPCAQTWNVRGRRRAAATR